MGRTSRMTRAGLIAGLFGCFSLMGLAHTLDLEGVAPLELGSQDIVRKAALQSALDQGMLKEGLIVNARSYTTAKGTTVESASVRPTETLGHIQIVREWVEDQKLHLKIRAETGAQCAKPSTQPWSDYKKKVLVTRFDIPNIAEVTDLPSIWSGLPLEFERRLKLTDKFRTEVTTAQAPLMSERDHDQVEVDLARLKTIARDRDAQIIVTGRLIDTHSHAARWFWQKDQRAFELDVRVIDGITGTEIARHRSHADAEGGIDLTGIPFASANFYASDYGQAVDQVLSTLAATIEDDLECLPFSTALKRVQGHKVYFNAGTLAGVIPGDTLALYQYDRQFPHQGGSAKQVLGIPEEPVGSVRVLSVQPQFSIAEVIEEWAPITAHEGDIVRFEAVH